MHQHLGNMKALIAVVLFFSIMTCEGRSLVRHTRSPIFNFGFLKRLPLFRKSTDSWRQGQRVLLVRSPLPPFRYPESTHFRVQTVEEGEHGSLPEQEQPQAPVFIRDNGNILPPDYLRLVNTGDLPLEQSTYSVPSVNYVQVPPQFFASEDEKKHESDVVKSVPTPLSDMYGVPSSELVNDTGSQVEDEIPEKGEELTIRLEDMYGRPSFTKQAYPAGAVGEPLMVDSYSTLGSDDPLLETDNFQVISVIEPRLPERVPDSSPPSSELQTEDEIQIIKTDGEIIPIKLTSDLVDIPIKSSDSKAINSSLKIVDARPPVVIKGISERESSISQEESSLKESIDKSAVESEMKIEVKPIQSFSFSSEVDEYGVKLEDSKVILPITRQPPKTESELAYDTRKDLKPILFPSDPLSNGHVIKQKEIHSDEDKLHVNDQIDLRAQQIPQRPQQIEVQEELSLVHQPKTEVKRQHSILRQEHTLSGPQQSQVTPQETKVQQDQTFVQQEQTHIQPQKIQVPQQQVQSVQTAIGQLQPIQSQFRQSGVQQEQTRIQYQGIHAQKKIVPEKQTLIQPQKTLVHVQQQTQAQSQDIRQQQQSQSQQSVAQQQQIQDQIKQNKVQEQPTQVQPHTIPIRREQQTQIQPEQSNFQTIQTGLQQHEASHQAQQNKVQQQQMQIQLHQSKAPHQQEKTQHQKTQVQVERVEDQRESSGILQQQSSSQQEHLSEGQAHSKVQSQVIQTQRESQRQEESQPQSSSPITGIRSSENNPIAGPVQRVVIKTILSGERLRQFESERAANKHRESQVSPSPPLTPVIDTFRRQPHDEVERTESLQTVPYKSVQLPTEEMPSQSLFSLQEKSSEPTLSSGQILPENKLQFRDSEDQFQSQLIKQSESSQSPDQTLFKPIVSKFPVYSTQIVEHTRSGGASSSLHIPEEYHIPVYTTVSDFSPIQVGTSSFISVNPASQVQVPYSTYFQQGGLVDSSIVNTYIATPDEAQASELDDEIQQQYTQTDSNPSKTAPTVEVFGFPTDRNPETGISTSQVQPVAHPTLATFGPVSSSSQVGVSSIRSSLIPVPGFYLPPHLSADTEVALPSDESGEASENIGVAILPGVLPRTHGVMGYRFNYNVEDEPSGTTFSRYEKSDGEKTHGQYSVLLPDGRTQIVEFLDDGLGFKADVRYV